jgi:hypothetical protein
VPGPESMDASQRQIAMAKLKLAYEEYAKELPERLNYIRDLLTRGMEQWPEQHQVILAEAKQEAHRIRGTASTCGFAKVTEQTGIIDDLLSANQQDCSSQLWWSKLFHALELASHYALTTPAMDIDGLREFVEGCGLDAEAD